MSEPRIPVKVTSEWDQIFLEGDLDAIIYTLQTQKKAGWEGIEMIHDTWNSDEPTPYLYKHRLENDREYEARMKKLKTKEAMKLKAEERAKERRRKQYECLKEEFKDD